MASASYKNIALDPTQYIDLVAAATTQNSQSLTGLNLTFQYQGPSDCRVFFGGASAPADGQGVALWPGQTIYGEAIDHVWAKGAGVIAPWKL